MEKKDKNEFLRIGKLKLEIEVVRKLIIHVFMHKAVERDREMQKQRDRVEIGKS